jgi:Probable Zinc-ribbon domain
MISYQNIKSLINTHPVIAKEAYGWDSSQVLSESHEKIAWRCSSKHIWVEKIINRTENNINCPKCEKIK